MELDEPTAADVLARLRRVEEQIGGIVRMIESDRQCREVVQQISAAAHALDHAGFRLIACGLRHCLHDQQAAARDGYTEPELEKLFLQLR